MDNIIISGMGVMTSIGNNVNTFWDGLLKGKTGVAKIRSFPVEDHPNQYGCEIPEFELHSLTDRNFGRATSLFITTLEDALFDAGLSPENLIDKSIGVCVGTTMGEIEALEDEIKGCDGAKKSGPGMIAQNVSDYYGFNGPLWTLTNACAAGNFAIARAAEELKLGRADIMIVGGVEAMSWAAFTGFSSLRAMSPDVCRPFDKDRKGLLLGEGAGVVILEKEEHLLKRGSRARAKILGYALGCDAHHITQPDPKGMGAVRTMKQALHHAGVEREAVHYVNAHGTGTQANDLMESKALAAFFGDKVKTSSIKGHIGHTLGAASAIEIVACVKAIETGILPPTINLRKKDPDCEIEVIANEPVLQKENIILSNAYAFGGINSSVVIAKMDE